MGKYRMENEVLRNTSINRIFLWRLPIQNHAKPSIHEKRRNKAIYLISNYIRLTFVRKTSMPLSKALDISSVTARKAPDLLKALAVLPDTTFRGSAVDREDLQPYWKSEKRSHFSRWSKLIIYKFLKDFTKYRKNTNRDVVFNCRLFPNNHKYWDHQWDLPPIWKTRLLQTHIEVFN